MQPLYDIVPTEAFVRDVTDICGDLRVFQEAFEGYDWYLARLPRGKGTWDLSPTGDLRLANLPATRLENGTDVPNLYFTFKLHLGAEPSLQLLRALRADDPRLLLLDAAS